MKIKNLLLLALSLLIYGNLYSQTVIISGKVTMVGNPCIEEPCLPGIVFAIETDSINYIITLEGNWQWDDPLVIGIHTFEMEDPITIEGIVSVKQDIWGEDYYEIEIVSVIPVSIDNDDTVQSGISVFPNPTTGFINIESSGKQIKDIEFIDLNGKKLLERKYSESPYSIRIDKQGILMLRILFIDDTQIIRKIVVL